MSKKTLKAEKYRNKTIDRFKYSSDFCFYKCKELGY